MFRPKDFWGGAGECYGNNFLSCHKRQKHGEHGGEGGRTAIAQFQDGKRKSNILMSKSVNQQTNKTTKFNKSIRKRTQQLSQWNVSFMLGSRPIKQSS